MSRSSDRSQLDLFDDRNDHDFSANQATEDPIMLNRRTVFVAAALAAPASSAPLGGALADPGACATDQSAANAALLERYVIAVNSNNAALRREVFAEPYLQHGAITGLRTDFPYVHLTIED